MNRYLLIDPASSKKKGSDYTSMKVIGLNVDNNYYLIDGVRDRMNLTERTNKVFEFHKKYKPLKTGYEQYAQQADKEHIEYEMDIRNYRFVITPLGGLTSKADRIKKLVPSFENGRFYMPGRLLFTDYEGKAKDLVAIIKDELNDFPVAAHDDCLDCIARILDPDIKAEFPELEEIGIFDKQSNLAEMEFNVFES
jgi:predicted phage terminase large subunit-like protein